jgi:hypothetical protein
MKWISNLHLNPHQMLGDIVQPFNALTIKLMTFIEDQQEHIRLKQLAIQQKQREIEEHKTAIGEHSDAICKANSIHQNISALMGEMETLTHKGS